MGMQRAKQMVTRAQTVKPVPFFIFVTDLQKVVERLDRE